MWESTRRGRCHKCIKSKAGCPRRVFVLRLSASSISDQLLLLCRRGPRWPCRRARSEPNQWDRVSLIQKRCGSAAVNSRGTLAVHSVRVKTGDNVLSNQTYHVTVSMATRGVFVTGEREMKIVFKKKKKRTRENPSYGQCEWLVCSSRFCIWYL